MTSLLYILLCYFSLAHNNTNIENTNKITSILQINYGAIFPNKNQEFFDIYEKDLGGIANSFKYSSIVGITNKFIFNSNYRIGASLNYYKFKLYDEFEQLIVPNQLLKRNIVENLTWEDYPILFIFEYNPNIKKQFNSYIGGGIGLVLSNIYWNENIETYSWDIRKGGIVYDEYKLYPTLRFYFGTELGFDKEKKESFLGGIIIEPRINYTFRQIDFFSPIRNQIPDAYYGINRKFWFNNFIFELNLGLTFNFYFKK